MHETIHHCWHQRNLFHLIQSSPSPWTAVNTTLIPITFIIDSAKSNFKFKWQQLNRTNLELIRTSRGGTAVIICTIPLKPLKLETLVLQMLLKAGTAVMNSYLRKPQPNIYKFVDIIKKQVHKSAIRIAQILQRCTKGRHANADATIARKKQLSNGGMNLSDYLDSGLQSAVLTFVKYILDSMKQFWSTSVRHREFIRHGIYARWGETPLLYARIVSTSNPYSTYSRKMVSRCQSKSIALYMNCT